MERHVYFLVVTKDNNEYLLQAIKSAGNYYDIISKNCSMLIWDNSETGAATRAKSDYTGELPIAIFTEARNILYSAGMNRLIAEATERSEWLEDIFVVMNDDVKFDPYQLELMVTTLCWQHCDVVGPMTNNCYGIQNFQQKHNFPEQLHKVQALNGFFFVTVRDVFDNVGVFDEEAFPLSGEEWDWCYRAYDEGYVLAIETGAFVHHYKHVTVNREGLDHYWGKSNLILRERYAGRYPRQDIPEK